MYFVIIVMFFGALGLLAGIWIWALLHCRGNQRLARDEMERWLIIIGLTPPVGAMVYLYKHRRDPVVLHLPVKH